MKTKLDITGNVYSGLTALEKIKVYGGHAFWLCKCFCGKETIVPINNLLSGNTKSCGCLRNKHGMKDTKEYRAWQQLKDRCSNPNYEFHKYYLEKGVKVCERWLNSFKNFFEDMGFAPSPNHSIDRYPDRDGNYEPKNCRWATKKQQSENRDYCVMITYNGETMNILDWSKKLNIHRNAFDYARSLGRPLEGVIAKHLDPNYDKDKWEVLKPYDISTGIHLEYNGTTMSLATWAKVLCIPYYELFRQIKYKNKTLDQVMKMTTIKKAA